MTKPETETRHVSAAKPKIGIFDFMVFRLSVTTALPPQGLVNKFKNEILCVGNTYGQKGIEVISWKQDKTFLTHFGEAMYKLCLSSLLLLTGCLAITYVVEHGINGVLEGPKTLLPLTIFLVFVPLLVHRFVKGARQFTFLAGVLSIVLPVCFFSVGNSICAIKKSEYPSCCTLPHSSRHSGKEGHASAMPFLRNLAY